MKVIIMIVALSTSFMPSKIKVDSEVKSFKKDISYYWFDTSLNYLRQNTLNAEAFLTGYNTSTNVPNTLREKGYAPANCYPTTPPVPIDPTAPDQLLYSHP